MNILIINPPNIPYSDKNLLIEPIDLIQLGSFLQRWHRVEFLDMDIKQMDVEQLKEYLLHKNFDIVIIAYDYYIPLHTKEALYNIKNISNILKKNNIKSILIGKTVTYKPLIIKELNIDIGISGEPEMVLKEILKENIIKNLTGIVYSKREKINLNEIPIANRKLVNINDYIDIRSILTSRGCLNHCNFCPIHNYWGDWRGKAAAAVVNEIEYLVTTFNTKKIIFLDDNATVDKERMAEICHLLINKNIQVTLGCLSSINCYNKELFKLMYKAGFRWIHFGIESGSQRILKLNNKYFSIEYAKQVIKECKKIGLRIRTSFILDLPGTEQKDMYKTIDFILETQPDEIRGHFLTPRLGTILAQDKIPEYIHSGEPLLENKNYLKKELLTDINILVEKLKDKQYSIIRDTAEWKNNEIKKFFAFCPAKYGIDWKI